MTAPCAGALYDYVCARDAGLDATGDLDVPAGAMPLPLFLEALLALEDGPAELGALVEDWRGAVS